MNLDYFNQNQKLAVTSDLGPVLVIAGAGSGKTQVLISRFEYLVEHYNFNINQILAITFTNKAANEMKTRLYKNLNVSYIPWVGTFHSICLRILREDIQALKTYDNNFSVIDDDDQTSIFKEAYKTLNITTKDINLKQIFHLVHAYETKQIILEDLWNERWWDNLNIKNKKDAILKYNILKYYLMYKQKNNLVSFDDLLFLTNQVLEIPEILEKWQNQFQYILVDEFQDTNDEQYKLIKNLSKKHQNIFAVGDPDQMIYTWRGASEQIIDNYKKDFDHLQIIILDVNYRSTQEILDASNHLITYNKNRIDKQLIANHGYSKIKPIYYHGSSQDNESMWVIKKIKELIDQNVDLNQITILYRNNSLSRNIEQTLINNQIPYKIFGGLKFYQRKEVKDLLAYLKAIYLLDELSIKRIINIPKRGISSANLEIVDKYAKEHEISFAKALLKVDEIENLTKAAISGIKQFNELIMNFNINQPMSKLFEQILKKINYEEYLKENEEKYRWENILELQNSIIDYKKKNPHATFTNYLQDVALITDHDEKNINGINLMTIHTAKGLEFDYVFIIGLNEEIFPSHFAITTNNIDEERRIAYVALTRAKKQLFFSSYEGVNYIFNTTNIKSRFIDEISKHFYELERSKLISTNQIHDQWFDSSKTLSDKERINNFSNKYEFKIGDQVVHTAFGLGHVLKIENNVLTIYFNDLKQKKEIAANHISIKRVVN